MTKKSDKKSPDMDLTSMDKRANFKINEHKLKRLHEIAKENGLTASLVLRLLVDDYLEKNGEAQIDLFRRRNK